MQKESSDTDPGIEKAVISQILSLSPEERLEKICSLSSFGRQFVAEGIKHRHPEYSHDQLRRELVRQLYGEEFYRSIFGSK